MNIDERRLTAAVADIREAISAAGQAFEEAVVEPMYRGESNAWELPNSDWHIEIVFLKLLVLCEGLGLSLLGTEIRNTLATAKKHPYGGLSAAETGPDDPYSLWLGSARQYVAAIETLAQPPQGHAATKSLVDILRATAYTIGDPRLFAAPPANEDELHNRIEGVLKCVFPDLKHKPTLTKPIKNYQPDTGLPSTKTLIEYKFIADAKVLPVIADQIFADTRGYHSNDWEHFVYVIYETKRFQAESQWQNLLVSADVPNSQIVVLSGEPGEPSNLPKLKRKPAPTTV